MKNRRQNQSRSYWNWVVKILGKILPNLQHCWQVVASAITVLCSLCLAALRLDSQVENFSSKPNRLRCELSQYPQDHNYYWTSFKGHLTIGLMPIDPRDGRLAQYAHLFRCTKRSKDFILSWVINQWVFKCVNMILSDISSCFFHSYML